MNPEKAAFTKDRTCKERYDVKTIPEYRYGVRSPATYNAGKGLGDNRIIEDPDSFPFAEDGKEMTEDEYRSVLTKLLSFDARCQYTASGPTSIRMFYNQRIVVVSWSDGRIHVEFSDDYEPSDEPDVTVTTHTGTTEDEFDRYLSELEACGFTRVYSGAFENNRFEEFTAERQTVRLNFTNGSTVRLIDDRVSASLDRFTESSEPWGTASVYQYGLFYARNEIGFSCNCGMCYFVVLPDRSVLLIDGGRYDQATAESMDGLLGLMRRACGEDHIRLKWFCTHGHADHTDALAKLLRHHRDEITLEKVFLNCPFPGNHGVDCNTFLAFNRIKKYCPSVIFRKVHMGDSFVLGGCRIDVLQTHEDNTGVNGTELVGYVNDTSTVIKIHMDASSSTGDTDFLVLGDIDQYAENVLLSHYTSATLHCGMVQTAHHLFNFLERLYDVVDADIACVPQTEASRRNHDSVKYQVVARTVPEENFYFCGSGTDSFEVKDGKIVHVLHEPLHGGIYDGSPL